jgi:hypothetical protein
LAEQLTLNQRVLGSSPKWRIQINHGKPGVVLFQGKTDSYIESRSRMKGPEAFDQAHGRLAAGVVSDSRQDARLAAKPDQVGREVKRSVPGRQ